MTHKPLSEQVILITGASSGIGEALAEVLARQFLGIRLVLAARNQQKLESLAERCEKAGAEVLMVPTDMAEVEQVNALAQRAIETFGQVDVLVNNAGYGQLGPIELIPLELAKRQFAVNFHGALAITQALIPFMREQGGGRIINVSSLGGRMAFPAGGLYSCSKFALEALSDVLRMELSAFNIKVVVIEPGPVKTGFFSVVTEKAQAWIPTEDTPYRPAIEVIQNMEQQTASLGWTSERVAKVIVQSLTARNPRPRYIAATGGNFLIFMMTKVFPTGFRDWFWKRFYGLNRMEKAWKNRSLT